MTRLTAAIVMGTVVTAASFGLAAVLPESLGVIAAAPLYPGLIVAAVLSRQGNVHDTAFGVIVVVTNVLLYSWLAHLISGYRRKHYQGSK